ncbi:MAG: hypothetical protein AAFZ63_07610 [Bacteroidota bacterium]
MKSLTIYLLAACLPLGLFAQHQINGEIVFPSGLPICEVLVELQDASGQTLAQDLSEDDGTFQFTNVPTGTNYELLFTKDGEAIWGVSTFDVVLVARLILGLDAQPPYYGWIGDLNGSGTVTTLDLVIMRKVILGIDSEFPVPPWAFDEPTAVTPDNQITLPAVNSDTDVEVIGVKRGDISGSIEAICN